MATTLKINMGLGNGSAAISPPTDVVDYSVTTTNDHVSAGRISIATSATAIPMGSVATGGWARFKNEDPTNFIKIRAGSGGADVCKLLAGESAQFRLGTNTPYAIADTGACDLSYHIQEA